MGRPGKHYRRLRNWYLLQRRSNNFLGSQWAGGVVLVIFAIIALFLANFGATKEWYRHILDSSVGFVFNYASFKMSVEHWINDGLMVLFFFVVGLEIKREIIAGELSNIKKASLPIMAAIGGMVVPAFVYFAFNAGTEFEAGWGIPMATDIAFAVGALSLLGRRVPLALKVFLTALAIVDDLGAILVIAIFYTSAIDFVMLGSGILLLLLLYFMNRRGVTSVILYLVPAVAIWYLFLNSGVHATIAGVLVAMAIPTRPRFSKKYFSYKVRYFLEDFKHHDRKGVEVLGKPLGIFLFCRMAIGMKFAVMPKRSGWTSLLGVACLGGIGFTMSIFIANLAFGGTPYVDSAKIAILVASVSAAIIGALVLNIASKRPATAGADA